MAAANRRAAAGAVRFRQDGVARPQQAGWILLSLVRLLAPDGPDFRIRSERNFIGRSETMDIAIAAMTLFRDTKRLSLQSKKSFKLHPVRGGAVYLTARRLRPHP